MERDEQEERGNPAELDFSEDATSVGDAVSALVQRLAVSLDSAEPFIDGRNVTPAAEGLGSGGAQVRPRATGDVDAPRHGLSSRSRDTFGFERIRMGKASLTALAERLDVPSALFGRQEVAQFVNRIGALRAGQRVAVLQMAREQFPLIGIGLVALAIVGKAASQNLASHALEML
jgi:hypothetical protein